MTMTIVADEGILNRVDNSVHLEKNVQATTEDGRAIALATVHYREYTRLFSSKPCHKHKNYNHLILFSP